MSNLQGMTDVLEALESAQAQYRIDASRLFLMGDCAGGRGALLLVEHAPQRFAAASVINASVKLGNEQYGEGDLDDEEEMDTADDGLYSRIGRLATTPLRLIHGDLYPHSPVRQVVWFRNQCMKNGFTPDLVIVPREGTLGMQDPVKLSFEFFKDKQLISSAVGKDGVAR